MSVLNREQFTARLQARVGDDTTDDGLSFVEDMMDTFNDMETRSSGNSEEQWKQKYEELDKNWRTKFQQRFFSSETTPGTVIDNQEEDVRDDEKMISFDDLFTEREG